MQVVRAPGLPFRVTPFVLGDASNSMQTNSSTAGASRRQNGRTTSSLEITADAKTWQDSARQICPRSDPNPSAAGPSASIKKTIKELEKIERGFLSEGRGAANGGSCHMNWRRVCRPISLVHLGAKILSARAWRSSCAGSGSTKLTRTEPGVALTSNSRWKSRISSLPLQWHWVTGRRRIFGRIDGSRGALFARSHPYCTPASPNAATSWGL
jgi:hypothetical protein